MCSKWAHMENLVGPLNVEEKLGWQPHVLTEHAFGLPTAELSKITEGQNPPVGLSQRDFSHVNECSTIACRICQLGLSPKQETYAMASVSLLLSLSTNSSHRWVCLTPSWWLSFTSPKKVA